jgi:uncharacterized membrane protein HdeD (DUF308 family)
MNHTTARRGPALALAALGALLLLAGIALVTVPFHDGTIPQWNGLCSSDIGQIGQFFDGSASRDCGMVSLADRLIGWLFALGVLGLAAAALLLLARPRPAR